MKKIPIGVENFKEIITNNYYYVDKTKFIEKILNDGSKIKLFTRPRRFGKTLNMSTIKHFFDIKNNEENRKLFNNLDIEKSVYIKEQGQYPIIFISMKGIKDITWEEAKSSLKILISKLYSEFKYLLDDLDEFDLPRFKKYLLADIDFANLKNALEFLTRVLYEKHKKEVILLIDEYDSPLISAYEHNYYDEAINFFKVFYGEALKTNDYLKMGIITGIIRVIKAGIFSDLNNLRVYSILDKQYSDFFGFTEKEVEKMLIDFNIEYNLPEVKSWYDGYKFGDTEVYNPWSILNFVQNRELEGYWIGTSGNFLIKEVLKDSNSEINISLEKLFNGEKIEEVITGNSDLSSLLSYHEIWELLLFSGYLTVDKKIDEDVYSLRLPNKEIRKFFKNEFIDITFGASEFRKTMEALRNNKIEEFEKNLQNILLNSTSYMDGKNENFYHGLFLGMSFYLDNKYSVKSNREAGLGRYDVLIEPINKKERAFILEFKVTDSEKKLENFSKEALEQIINKKYNIELIKKGIKDITYIGIAFYKKQLRISYK
ncbi:AAA family ATPase [Fusobacterium polymorphum]|uniref:AAA family ATPase n=1 Tax=Fusobacterium nucleatum subsp. polymorphum TaxID=76857 RepID=UPI001C6F561F|nr:AAA family ATPase [Fusobacterium polymorphum]QYR62211.1 AAA family ATPase [Fusobacterium polymorphum]